MTKHFTRLPSNKSFWLRCWRVGGGHGEREEIWRFSLEDPSTGRKRGFTELQALLAFLELELDHEQHTNQSRRDIGGCSN